MGYVMTLHKSKFCIKKENVARATEALKNVMMESCLSTNRSFLKHHFGEDFNPDDLDVKLVFEAWRWHPVFESEDPKEPGDITDIWFMGEKIRDDSYFFSLLAPYVESGSYLVMIGEDHEIWRWYFSGGECLEQEGEIYFNENGEKEEARVV